MVDHMDVVSPTSFILVAVMNNPRDMEIARLLGWYRIPLRTAPKIIAVDFLAFYQTSAFGEEKERISFLAPVKGHELTTRAELLRDEVDHPRAREEYFKIQLGPLISLPNPIKADRWRRITFLYTTGEYFSKAQTINDLVIHSEERETLWKALRERALQSQEYRDEALDIVEIEPELLKGLLGIKENKQDYLSPISDDYYE